MSVNVVSNRAPFAVGTASLSSEDMFMSGGRGKAVRILHFYGERERYCDTFFRGSSNECYAVPFQATTCGLPAAR